MASLHACLLTVDYGNGFSPLAASTALPTRDGTFEGGESARSCAGSSVEESGRASAEISSSLQPTKDLSFLLRPEIYRPLSHLVSRASQPYSICSVLLTTALCQGNACAFPRPRPPAAARYTPPRTPPRRPPSRGSHPLGPAPHHPASNHPFIEYPLPVLHPARNPHAPEPHSVRRAGVQGP